MAIDIAELISSIGEECYCSKAQKRGEAPKCAHCHDAGVVKMMHEQLHVLKEAHERIAAIGLRPLLESLTTEQSWKCEGAREAAAISRAAIDAAAKLEEGKSDG